MSDLPDTPIVVVKAGWSSVDVTTSDVYFGLQGEDGAILNYMTALPRLDAIVEELAAAAARARQAMIASTGKQVDIKNLPMPLNVVSNMVVVDEFSGAINLLFKTPGGLIYQISTGADAALKLGQALIDAHAKSDAARAPRGAQ